MDTNTMLAIGIMLRNGAYRVERQLSAGGFGNTYLVRNMAFNELFALKEFFMRGVNMRKGNLVTVSVPDNHASYESQKEKFKKEAVRLRNLRNPHIVKVHDLFEENGTVYYVMDYINGESVSELLKRTGNPLSEQQTLQILRQLLDALGEVHSQQIWHLDIKPGNIMLDSAGNAYLIDFGASKQFSTQGVQTSSAMAYTPGYAPVEQVEQALDKFGPWTDFYALGATLYYMQTLQQPPTATALSEGNAFNFPPTMSPMMQHLISWMMNPQRKMRPLSVDHVWNFLQQGTPRPVPPFVTGPMAPTAPMPQPPTGPMQATAPMQQPPTGSMQGGIPLSQPANGPMQGRIPLSQPATGPVSQPVSGPVSGPTPVSSSMNSSASGNDYVSSPVSDPLPEPAKKNTLWLKVAAGVLALALLGGGAFLLLGKSKEQKAAEADQQEYLDLVEECRSAMRRADNFPDLAKAKTKLDEVENYELRHAAAMPEVYNQLDDLKEYYAKMQQKQRGEYIELAQEAANNEHDYYMAFRLYQAASEALPDDSELKDYMNSLAPKLGYLNITGAEFSNSERDGTDIEEAGETLHANRMRYLFPRITYNSMLPTGRSPMKLDLTYKIIKPDGTLDHSSNSPSGYTTTSSFTVDPDEENMSVWLSGWGNATQSNYESGTYSFELYYRGNKIFETEFELE